MQEYFQEQEELIEADRVFEAEWFEWCRKERTKFEPEDDPRLEW
jgi:hypothetical protein